MTTVTDCVSISAPIYRVYEYCWRAELWPKITPHVRKVELLEASADHQRMRMVVESHAKLYTVESERHTVPGESITYRQMRPPVFLSEHSGEWRFSSSDGQTRVELTHRFQANRELARQVLGLSETGNVDTLIGERLKTNGRLTLLAVKQVVEREHQSTAAEPLRSL